MDRSVTDDVLRSRSRTAAVLPQSSPLPSPESTSVVLQWMSGGVIAVVVLGCLCVVLGLVYAYIYFRHISPRAGRSASGAAGRSSRKNMSQLGDNGSSVGASTHVFLFKKS